MYAAELRRVFALRYKPWPIPSQDIDGGTKVRLADAIRGCVYGAALGDAVGLATEFLSRSEVSAHYGPSFEFAPGCEVHRDSHRISFPQGDWTDDTDQLLLVLMSLLETEGAADPVNFASKLLEWKENGFAGLGDQGGAGLGQSTKRVLLADGFASDPIGVAQRIWEAGGMKAAANGAVMRTAVVGIPSFWNLNIVEDNAAALCRTTHADPRCVASCIAVADCVALMLQEMLTAGSKLNLSFGTSEPEESSPIAQGILIGEALERAIQYSECSDSQAREFHRLVSVETLDELQLDEPHSIGYTFKCAACALHTLQHFSPEKSSFMKAICDVTAQGGDADTNAAVTGALLGCSLGYSRLPMQWISAMPYATWLEAWVQKVLYVLGLPVNAGN
uniref:ADP-ribosylglycohydrolase n=1 Tax=Eutreptiella gymnastica TaxID=73025 RepID=A0A7S1IIF9_9EUGL